MHFRINLWFCLFVCFVLLRTQNIVCKISRNSQVEHECEQLVNILDFVQMVSFVFFVHNVPFGTQKTFRVSSKELFIILEGNSMPNKPPLSSLDPFQLTRPAMLLSHAIYRVFIPWILYINRIGQYGSFLFAFCSHSNYKDPPCFTVCQQFIVFGNPYLWLSEENYWKKTVEMVPNLGLGTHCLEKTSKAQTTKAKRDKRD